MRNGESMKKNELRAMMRTRVALPILGVFLFPVSLLQAQGGVGQEMADLQKRSEQIASPIVRQQQAEQTAEAKRKPGVGDSGESELQQELARALDELKRTRQLDADRASEAAARAAAALKGAQGEFSAAESSLENLEREVERLARDLDSARSAAGQADKTVSAAQRGVKDGESEMARAKAALSAAKHPAEATKRQALADKAAADLAARADKLAAAKTAAASTLGNVKSAETAWSDAQARRRRGITPASVCSTARLGW